MLTHTSGHEIRGDIQHHLVTFTFLKIHQIVCLLCPAHLISGIEAQVLMTLFTVVVGVVGCIFRQLDPRCPPA